MVGLKMSASVRWVVTFTAVTLLGVLIGCWDIHVCNGFASGSEPVIYFIVSALLGHRFPKFLWLGPIIFAVTLYGMHIWALRHGYRQPYVEKNEEHAFACLLFVFPGLLGGTLGWLLPILTKTRTEKLDVYR